MDDDDLRIQRLERHMARLEARIHRLEGTPDREWVTEEAEPFVPAPPVQSAPPPPPPVVPALGRAPVSYRTATTAPPAPVTPPAPVPAWVEPPALHPAIGLRDLEDRFAGRAMAWIGGFALVAAAVFFLSLAFSRGWISEELRVVVGLVAGAVILSAGAVAFDRRAPLMGNVLTAVGLGIVSVALFAATRAYELIPPELGLAGALVAAIAAAAIAIRFDVREVAAFGLIAALIAPPVMGASPTTLTLAFVAVTLIGTTAVALFRSWRWLPPLAFILAGPQLASWLTGDPVLWQALVALGGFWLVNIVAAAGEEARIRRDDLRPSSATLVLANATFLLWGGWVLFRGDLAGWLGTFIGISSLAHLVLGAAFLRRQGLEHLFGNLVAGTGVALVAIAAFVQLGAPVVPLAWGAEAVALAWLAVRRRHRWSALAGLAVGSLAVAHLVLLEYPVDLAGLTTHAHFATAWAHPEAGSLAAVLASIAVAVLVVPIRWIRSVLAGVAVLLAAYAATFEATGPGLAACLIAVALAGMILDRALASLGTRDGLEPVASWSPFGWYATGAAATAGAVAIALLFATEYPVRLLGSVAAAPFDGPRAVSLLIVLVGLATAAALTAIRGVRSALVGIGVLLVTWALPFEVTGVALVATQVVLLPLAVVGDRALARLPEDRSFAALALPRGAALLASSAGVLAWVAGAWYALARFVPPMSWGSVTPPSIPFSDERALVAALVAGAALAAARWVVPPGARRAGVLAAIVAGAVVVPFEVFADGVVVLWLGLAGLAVVAARLAGWGRSTAEAVAVILAGGAAIVAWAIVAPPARLWVVDPTYVARAPLLAGWPMAFVAVAAALYLAPRYAGLAAHRPWFEVAAAATGAYLASVAVVDVFQRMTGGSIAVEELAKQAQVALSVCWTAIGVAALAWGLESHDALPRHIGFGLLGLATVKVFIVDLAAMDVAYRALVLAGLGVLLLLSAWLYTHLRGPRAGTPGLRGPRPAG